MHEEGLLHELMELLLLPWSKLESLPAIYASADYVRAQRDGGYHGDCTLYEDKCGVSLFEIVTAEEPEEEATEMPGSKEYEI